MCEGGSDALGRQHPLEARPPKARPLVGIFSCAGHTLSAAAASAAAAAGSFGPPVAVVAAAAAAPASLASAAENAAAATPWCQRFTNISQMHPGAEGGGSCFVSRACEESCHHVARRPAASQTQRQPWRGRASRPPATHGAPAAALSACLWSGITPRPSRMSKPASTELAPHARNRRNLRSGGARRVVRRQHITHTPNPFAYHARRIRGLERPIAAAGRTAHASPTASTASATTRPAPRARRPARAQLTRSRSPSPTRRTARRSRPRTPTSPRRATPATSRRGRRPARRTRPTWPDRRTTARRRCPGRRCTRRQRRQPRPGRAAP